MLRALELENFKGIGERQRIEFAPVTLLFGKNSAGKSSILHALLYLHELLATGNPDVRHTKLGGASLDLGGFNRLIHKHDLKRTMRIRIEFGVTASMLAQLDAMTVAVAADYLDLSVVDDAIDEVWFEFEIRDVTRGDFTGACVTQMYMGMGSAARRPILKLTQGRDLKSGSAVQAALDLKASAAVMRAHRIDFSEDSDEALEEAFWVTDSELWDWAMDGDYSRAENHAKELHELHARITEHREQMREWSEQADQLRESAGGEAGDSEDAQQRLQELRDLVAKIESLGNRTEAAKEEQKQKEALLEDIRGDWEGLAEAMRPQVVLDMVGRPVAPEASLHRWRELRFASSHAGAEPYRAAIDGLVRILADGPLEVLETALADVVHIGPLRCVPTRAELVVSNTRTYAGDGEFGSSRLISLGAGAGAIEWRDGRKAWATLAERLEMHRLVNYWLKRLGAGVALVHSELSEDLEYDDEPEVGEAFPWLIQLGLLTDDGQIVWPSEVGVGLAQLMPVIVACLRGSKSGCVFEQPELHLHPAIQVELADLFWESAVTGGIRIIETHSEHIILRLKRRIAEGGGLDVRAPGMKLLPEHVNIYAFDELGATRKIRLDEHGEFMDRWPGGFFPERRGEV